MFCLIADSSNCYGSSPAVWAHNCEQRSTRFQRRQQASQVIKHLRHPMGADCNMQTATMLQSACGKTEEVTCVLEPPDC